MLGEKHGYAFVVADPAGVGISAVGEMRREQSIEAIVGELALQGFEAGFLQNHIAVRVSEDFLVNAVTSADLGVHEFKCGDTGFDGLVFEGAVAFFFREEIATIGDHESEVAGAGLVDPREIYFIDNSVTNGEPHLAMLVQGCTNAGLGARSPAWGNSGPAGGVTRMGIAHKVSS